MPLIDLKTDLKSLKYGLDRRGMGSSKEPFITKAIPEGETPGATRDVLLRQGSIVSSVNDVSRLTQLFTTTRGLTFIANQNLLSRGSVKTEATLGPAYGGGNVNQGIYSPTSTLAQAGVGFTGTHLNLLGLDPSSPVAGVVEGGLFPGGGLIRYEQAVFDFNKNGLNRLVKLKEDKIDLDPNSTELLSYGGGPNSVLGIGKTRIKRTSNTTGINPYGNPDGGYVSFSKNKVANSITYFNDNFSSGSVSEITYGAGSPNILVLSSSIQSAEERSKVKVAEAKTYFNNNYSSPLKITDSLVDLTGVNILPRITPGSYNSEENFPRGVANNNEIITLKTAYQKPNGSDLMYTTRNKNGQPGKEYKANPNFKRYNYGNLTKEGDYDYTKDKFGKENTKLLNTSKIEKTPPDSQLFKFYINLINANGPEKNQYLYWQAYLDNFNDQIGADYESYNYVGRGYPLYKYKGFTRSIGLDFTIVASTPTQILPIYQKLNSLIQNMAPNYSDAGYLRGNFVKLTVGDYLNNVPGIITRFSLSPIFEAGFDIGGEGENTSGKQLPKAIKVSGFNFTPITSNNNKLVSSDSQFFGGKDNLLS